MSDRALASVEKPARYAGGEWNAVRKDASGIRARVALAFPDLYEIGMSYLGQKILYDLANARPDVLAERVFAPWPDFEGALRAAGEPLRSLESGTPLREFDLVAFSLLYELNDSNILTILDLGGIALEAAERGPADPLILAGGPAAFNPEPLAGIFDAFFLGDGEEGFLEIVEAWCAESARGLSRAGKLALLAAIPGVYVPSLYEAFRPEGSPLLAVRPGPGSGAPAVVRKRVLESFARWPFPERIVVPNIQAVFDRVAVEVARGCPQKCRFCQATSLYAPYRVKDPACLVRSVLGSLEATGYEDASLFGLSVGDYPHLEAVVEALMGSLGPRKISLSLSSLRPKRLSPEIVESITKVRKTGFTLVPEAGTERLRGVINKSVRDGEIWEAAETAFRRGWRLLKLYFMIGLPTETDEDVAAIPALIRELSARGRAILGGPPRIHASLASFIPKPHTPFQWLSMEDPEALLDKQHRVRLELRRERSVEIKTHDVRQSVLEAAFSRGDRALHGVLRRAWEGGARFDGWNDHFKPELWDRAFLEAGVDPGCYRLPLGLDARLPWDHIDTGMTKEFFKAELASALRAEFTPACTERLCGDCRGCAYAAIAAKKFAPAPAFATAVPAPDAGGDAPLRCGIFFSKTGRLRFLGHNDLVNALQRVFRRAGVDVLHSEGFHPKPVLSFGPALPLGMEGKSEFFEFKTKNEIPRERLLERLNAASPEGLRFLDAVPLSAGAPKLIERLKEAVYALDLGAEDVGRAARAAAGAKFEGWTGSPAEAVRRLLQAPEIQAEFGSWLLGFDLDEPGKTLRLRAAFSARKIPRPQDLIARALGLERPVYFMTREKFIFEE